MTKPATPTRQPKPSLSICPIGADSSAPSDPAAETMPITVLRTVAGTARADTDIAIALAVQASEVPISTPAPIRIGIIPCAVAISARPTMYISEPTIMIGRKPQRTVSAPATGCKNPQARFCTASASVNCDTEMPMSCVSGCMKMPKLCRRPMLSVSISEAPIRMGSVGRRTCSRDIVLVLPRGRISTKSTCDSRIFGLHRPV